MMMIFALCAALQDVSEYCPTRQGMTWTYVWEDGKIDKVVSEGMKEVGEWEYLCLAFDVQNGASQRKEYFWFDEGSVTYVGTDLEADEPAHDVQENPRYILKAGAKKGDTWEWVDGEHVTKFEHLGEEEVTVPAGKYRALKVQYRYTLVGEACVVTEWYAKGVGLVKKVDVTGTAKSEMVLKEVK
jgi:hypothetical protein